MSKKKADKVFARMAFEDVVIPLEDAENNDITLIAKDCYLVCYEDEEGYECEEDGTYLN